MSGLNLQPIPAEGTKGKTQTSIFLQQITEVGPGLGTRLAETREEI